MEDLSVGAEEGGEEIELSLGLSIGGNSRKSPKLNSEEQKTANAEEDRNISDPHSKREILALRRQEARKKREEKLRKRGFCDDVVGMQAQRVEIRARDREMREKEDKVEGRECDKREKNEERRDHDGAHNLSQASVPVVPYPPLDHNGVQNVSQGSVPVVPYPPLQFVPLANGFVYPCAAPCLAPAGSSEKNDGVTVLRPLACRGFWPGQGGLRPGDLAMGGSESELNGSPVCGSSVDWENQSSSQQGGSSSSSDTGSHSSNCKPDQSQLKYTCKKNTTRAVPSRAIKSSPTKLMEQIGLETQPNPDDKPLTSQNLNPGSMKVASDQGLDAPSLSQMPCVSTTGNGPNGKTITGFLYRYTKTEVSIVCVCHGSSFSPAEFVEHAGGEDITHPLRHITVIPSTFG